MNDETFEEKISFRLSRMNVYVVLSAIILTMVLFTLALVFFTPMKEYIPGFADVTLRSELEDQKLVVDSLENIVSAQNYYFLDLKRKLKGEIDTTFSAQIANDGGPVDINNLNIGAISPADSAIRADVEKRLDYSLNTFSGSGTVSDLRDIQFYLPLDDGIMTSVFDSKIDHYGIDMVGPKDSPIKSVLDGVVIISDWTLETGYVIGIQHQHNLISFYKHNSFLFKKVGNFVKTGEVIAIIGDSGELSTGPHLHFEMWYDGAPVDPLKFLNL